MDADIRATHASDRLMYQVFVSCFNTCINTLQDQVYANRVQLICVPSVAVGLMDKTSFIAG